MNRSQKHWVNFVPLLAVAIIIILLSWRFFMPGDGEAIQPDEVYFDDFVIARVNGVDILFSDFVPYRGFWGYYSYGLDPEELDDPDFIDELLDSFIEELLQRGYIQSLGITVDENELEYEFTMTEASLFHFDYDIQAEIEKDYGFNAGTLRELLRGYMLAEAYINYLTGEIETHFSEEDFQAAYTEYMEYFINWEECVSASHILIKDFDEAGSVLERLHAGEEFTLLAAEHSVDYNSAIRGGYLGAFTRGVMVPEFEDAAFALTEPGELSELVETDFGFHIIMLHQYYEEGSYLSFADTLNYLPMMIAEELYDMEMYELYYSAEIVYYP